MGLRYIPQFDINSSNSTTLSIQCHIIVKIFIRQFPTQHRSGARVCPVLFDKCKFMFVTILELYISQ